MIYEDGQWISTTCGIHLFLLLFLLFFLSTLILDSLERKLSDQNWSCTLKHVVERSRCALGRTISMRTWSIEQCLKKHDSSIHRLNENVLRFLCPWTPKPFLHTCMTTKFYVQTQTLLFPSHVYDNFPTACFLNCRVA